MPMSGVLSVVQVAAGVGNWEPAVSLLVCQEQGWVRVQQGWVLSEPSVRIQG